MQRTSMASFLVFILFFGTKHIVQARSQFSSSVTKRDVYQPDRILCANTGDLATLRCCIIGTGFNGVVIWYKQPNGKQPRIMYRSNTHIFYNEFHNLRFGVKRSSECYNMTISDIIQSDEAMYYCATTSPHSVFGDGTYLKIKVTSKPAPCDDSMQGNSTNINTPVHTEKEMIQCLHGTVVGLGTALGLSALLIMGLAYFLLTRRKCDLMNTAMEGSPAMSQESEPETVTYAALRFHKQKANAEKLVQETNVCTPV